MSDLFIHTVRMDYAVSYIYSISMGKKIKNAHLQITLFILSLPTPNSLPINFHLASCLLFVGKRIIVFFSYVQKNG